jgi:hypothetical protein
MSSFIHAKYFVDLLSGEPLLGGGPQSLCLSVLVLGEG